jgi:hypothetical protein
MVVIKRKEKRVEKPISVVNAKMSEKSKKKLRRPQDVQPISTVCVS